LIDSPGRRWAGNEGKARAFSCRIALEFPSDEHYLIPKAELIFTRLDPFQDEVEIYEILSWVDLTSGVQKHPFTVGVMDRRSLASQLWNTFRVIGFAW